LDLARWSQHSASGGSAIANGFAKAVELVGTPLLCGIAGHFLDRWLGTGPVLTALFVVWALVVTVIMTVQGYVAEMRAEEDRLLGPRSGRHA
jgi:F0F1-type ATP synthase assembly protein I